MVKGLDGIGFCLNTARLQYMSTSKKHGDDAHTGRKKTGFDILNLFLHVSQTKI